MLINEHQTSVYRYLRYLGADAASAEDLTQDTFLAAFKSASAPDTNNVPLRSAWLRGISRNLLLAHCRRRRANPVRVDSEYLAEAEDVWSAQFVGDEDGSGYTAALRECLSALPDRDRRLLDLRYVHRKSRAEMANLRKMSPDGVKSQLRRVRSRLADCVRRRIRTGGAQ
ncbi:MAG: sigma-70 family RNA polymerase sigma factor [Phycisphaerae bacterium]|jgi:RNA polymerase sigma-70 factor (ECF subfamily)|nr:sigma-70 family RNA polymerase sigma factor [Phycisphaerae bacterium]